MGSEKFKILLPPVGFSEFGANLFARRALAGIMLLIRLRKVAAFSLKRYQVSFSLMTLQFPPRGRFWR